MTLPKKKAVFLDRDGVINRALLVGGRPAAPRTFDEFELAPGVADALMSFKEGGFLTVVVTNQPDVPRGIVRMEELDKMTHFIREQLPLTDVIICLHDDYHNCLCRKPLPGMLHQAAEKWGIDLEASFFIGDTWKDMEAGSRAGCRTILIDTLYNKDARCDFRVKNLKEAAEIICPV